jgi:small-conductance mechanosensitive channel
VFCCLLQERYVPLNCLSLDSAGASFGGGGLGSCAWVVFNPIAETITSASRIVAVKVDLSFIFGFLKIFLVLLAILICLGAYNHYFSSILIGVISENE